MIDAIQTSYEEFFKEQEKSLSAAKLNLTGHNQAYLHSYGRLISLNAWRKYVFPKLVTQPAEGFYIEAQNDFLVSLILARHGMWRPSLQSMRSGIENTLSSLYFKDHPIEYTLWQNGKLKTSFTELKQYFEIHPELAKFTQTGITGLSLLAEQYGELSRAVHGSALRFRMTAGTDVPIAFTADKIRLGQWMTNQKKVLLGINLLLTSLFRDHLKGTAHSNLRTALSLVFPPNLRTRLKAKFGITIPHPK